MTPESVAVIVPTLAQRSRRNLLRRALTSIFDQDGVRPRPIVIVNGRDPDPDTVSDLEGDPRVTLLTQERADLPAALQIGRAHVREPWFTSLDDDDLLLPGALQKRVQALQEAPGFDAVVTGGLVSESGDSPKPWQDMQQVAGDPLAALAASNWLLPGAWLCRADDSSLALFDGMPRHLECTYLAIRLVTTRRVRFIDDPTVIWYAGTPESASKSLDYLLGQPRAIERILELDLPAGLRACFRRRRSASLHACARQHIADRRALDAWHAHAQSIGGPRGWRYLPYTLTMLARSFRLMVQPG